MTATVNAVADPLEDIERLLEQGDHRSARGAMLGVLGLEPTTATCQAIAGLAASLDPARAEVVEQRVAFLGNMTLDLFAPLHVARGLTSRLLIRPLVADYDTWAQELLDPQGRVARFDPHVIVLALHLDGLAPALTTGFLERDAAGVARDIERVADRIAEGVRALRTWSKAKLLLHSFPLPADRALGIADAAHPLGQTAALRALNDRLAALAAELRDVHLVDLDTAVTRVGWSRWQDARMQALASLPYTPAAMHAITELHLRYLRAVAGVVRKVLVVDLDNTLWGGVVGEDGPEGIKLGEGYPGSAYRGLQQAILQLHRRGVVLAINSHNNPEDADEILTRHPEMVLRPEHFAARRINWDDKAGNMLELAEELGLGVESFVFLEDSDAQCERIRQALPEVLVVQQSGDVAARVGQLTSLGVFDSLGYSEEDRARGAFYRTESQRAQLKRSAPSLEGYLSSLEMKLRIEPITSANLGRVADLTQRTNQFNFTTPRHTKDSLTAWLAEPGREGHAFRLADRFGDYGLIAVTLLDRQADVATVEAFLMSCRVLKRSVEETILGYLLGRARAMGAARVRGLYRPTRKNGQVAGFYAAHGFRETGRESDGTVVLERDADDAVALPDFIQVGEPD
jgi:FkbH-like protein